MILHILLPLHLSLTYCLTCCLRLESLHRKIYSTRLYFPLLKSAPLSLCLDFLPSSLLVLPLHRSLLLLPPVVSHCRYRLVAQRKRYRLLDSMSVYTSTIPQPPYHIIIHVHTPLPSLLVLTIVLSYLRKLIAELPHILSQLSIENECIQNLIHCQYHCDLIISNCHRVY